MEQPLFRSEVHLHKAEVENVLPQYFKTYHPELIALLEAYYETLESEDGEGFIDLVHDVFHSRDLIGTDDYLFKFLLPELTNGVDITETLTDYRTKAHLLANYYRKKGSLHGFKEFFRWLLGEEVEIVYTKKNMFLLNDPNSKIGTKSYRYIKNDKLYQKFALQIKAGKTVSVWRDLYKQYCHPAGFYFEGYVILASAFDLNLSDMPQNVRIDYIELDPQTVTFDTEVSSTVVANYADSSIDTDSSIEIMRLDLNVSEIANRDIQNLIVNYSTIGDLLSQDSPTFDMYNEIDFANDEETMDQTTFSDNV